MCGWGSALQSSGMVDSYERPPITSTRAMYMIYDEVDRRSAMIDVRSTDVDTGPSTIRGRGGD